jgi:hypothetical protein
MSTNDGNSKGLVATELPVAEAARTVYASREGWEWFGSAAHLIVGRDCRFHLATFVGPWLVSTVGEWLPDSGSWDIYADRVGGIPTELRGADRRNWFLKNVGSLEIGAGRKYETMVFPWSGERCTDPECGCGLPIPEDWCEIDSDGYNDAGSATRGHYAMCEMWADRPASATDELGSSPASSSSQAGSGETP